MQLTASMRLPHLSLGLKKGCSLQFQAVALIEISRLTEKMLPPLVTLARVVALVVLFRSALWLLEHWAYWGGSSWIWIPRKRSPRGPTRSHFAPWRGARSRSSRNSVRGCDWWRACARAANSPAPRYTQAHGATSVCVTLICRLGQSTQTS